MLVEGEDYYLNEKGLIVLSGSYLLKRGYCCGSGCTNCPYSYKAVPEPKRTLLLKNKENKSPDSLNGKEEDKQ